MASNMQFGEVLRTARERAGIDIATAAHALRIRVDIVRAIEESDLSRMPQRGYARNMVSSYARYLGLNPQEITRLYLDAAYAHEVGRARGGDQRASVRNGRRREAQEHSSGTRGRSSSRSQFEEGSSSRSGEGGTSALGRKQYSDSRNGQLGRSSEGSRGLAQRAAADRIHPSRRSALPSSQYTNFYAGPASTGSLRSKLPLIAAAVIILILLIVILVLAFGRGGSSSVTDEVPNVPITGLSDTTGGDDSTSDDDETVTVVEPTFVEVTYEVVSGASPWIEVYENDSSVPVFAGVVSGPAEESFEVTGTLTITTPQPGNVTVTVDGTAVELTGDDGDSVYSYTVDFNAYLEQWREENGTSTSSASE